MLRNWTKFLLVLVLLLSPLSRMAQAQQQSKDVERTMKVKSEVLKRGTGEKARVTVKLLNGEQVKGFISQTGEDKFTVTDEKTSNKTEIAYSEVKKIKGRGLSTGVKIGIFAAIGVGALAAFVAGAAHSLGNINPFPNSR